ncbi:MAG: F0F1 ATP synthase subunit B [Patescibacteria group bacterium]
MELLSKLGIDLGLLIAQMVNFGILVGVLTFFIYRPLLNVIDARREKIRKAMEDANMIERQKKELVVRRTAELHRIDQECGAFMEKTKQQAEKAKQEILASARTEAEQTLERGRKMLEEERMRVFAEVQGILSSLILRMTEKILEREFGKSDQERIMTSLEKELPHLLQ